MSGLKSGKLSGLMKTTKVYRGPGYPVDPKKQEVRVWRAVLETAFEMFE